MDATVVFDLETGGLDARRDDILSIAASCNGKAFDAYVRNTQPIPAAASAVNGIFEADVAGAEPWSVVGPRFLRWVRETAGPRPVLVAYNGFRFDVPFLKAKFAALPPDASLPVFEELFEADAYVAASRHISRCETPGGKMSQAAVYQALFGAPPAGQHSARGDVDALDAIVRHDRLREVVMATARPLAGLVPAGRT